MPVTAYPAIERKDKVEDFEYIDFIYDEFTRRLLTAMDSKEDLGVLASIEDDDD
jgi:hypothetical protein